MVFLPPGRKACLMVMKNKEGLVDGDLSLTESYLVVFLFAFSARLLFAFSELLSTFLH